jgi:LysM repeat protein
MYTVVAGDTVGALAARYNSTVEAIIAANGLNSDALIYVGQELIIPVRSAAPTAVPTSVPGPTQAAPTAVQPTPIGILPTSTPIGIINGDTSSGFTVYTVQRGDTLSRIAAQYNINLQTLVQLNGILNPNLIQVGQQLRVPGSAQPQATPSPQVQPTARPATPRTHVVQRGENLFRISLRYGVPVATLASLNGILNTNLVYVGQVITLP